VKLWDLFSMRHTDEVTGTKVLLCSLGQKFAKLLHDDRISYSRFYSAVTATDFSTIKQLSQAFEKRYDIVHLFCDVSTSGTVVDGRGNTITGTSLIEKCADSDVKLLWIANENEPEGYIKGFKLGGKHINLVMTITRNSSKFSTFLEKLLSRLSRGETMPVAWAALAPQAPGRSQQDLPSCIFAAGRPGVKLR
jgi:hypothetical protein